MKSDEKQQAKSDLLRELESLREQLTDPAGHDLHENDIPILLDKVEQVVSTADAESLDELDDETAALQAAYDLATGDLPERDILTDSQNLGTRQPLFELAPAEQSNQEFASPTPRPVARGENPFLPKHIRDRLNERRQLLANDIAQASSFFSNKADTRAASEFRPLSAEHQHLIDEIVADYLPRIERDLRRRLQEKLANSSPSAEEDDR